MEHAQPLLKGHSLLDPSFTDDAPLLPPSSRQGRFQTRRNASPESLTREASLEHRPGGARPTILKLPPTRRATRKRPWTTWLTQKLLWTHGIRKGGGKGATHNES